MKRIAVVLNLTALATVSCIVLSACNQRASIVKEVTMTPAARVDLSAPLSTLYTGSQPSVKSECDDCVAPKAEGEGEGFISDVASN